MSDENVPMDATAMQAEAVVKAAIAWAWSLETHRQMRMTSEEWELFAALRSYGDKFKGLRGQ